MPYLAAAFIGVWVIVTGYVVYMSQRHRQLEQEMQTLEELVADQSRNK